MAGSVSGGCVETDVYQRALRVLDTGVPELAVYSTVSDADFKVGLTCGGEIDVWIEPFVPNEAWRVFRRAAEDRRAATWVVPLSPLSLLGRHLTVCDNGERIGAIDSDLDKKILEHLKLRQGEGWADIVEFDWCAKPVSLFVQSLPLAPRLFIIGGTHTGIHLCRLAKELGFYVSVIDAREPFATKERFPDADELNCAWPDEVLLRAGLDVHSYLVTLTHDPKFDTPSLANALRTPACYIGALGSRKTHAGRCERLQELGFSEADLARIHSPVGLDIGARTPEEVALSILAQMVAVRYGRAGGALNQRTSPIHADE